MLLDQFTRNIYRDSPHAFSGDHLALELALDGIGNGDAQRLTPVQRVFLYLPLEHAEDRVLQARSVELFRRLRDSVTDTERPDYENFLDYAERHREVVDRFGRFPHRNRILGRESSPEELEFLDQPGSSF